jgi:2-dehydropantoate 2-reductase
MSEQDVLAPAPGFCYNPVMEETAKMRVVVLGGGAIGSVLAAALAARGRCEVRLVGRRAHARAIREKGLKVHGMFHSSVQLTAREDIDFSLEETLLAVTVKAGDLETALRPLVLFLRPTTTLLLLQNGWGIRELALRVLGPAVSGKNVFVGIVAMGATFLGPGEVRSFGGGIRCEPAFAGSPFFSLFSGLPFTMEPSRDIRRDLWTKLLVNAVINPLSVILQGHNRRIAETRFDGLKTPILAEGRAVAAAEGVPLDLDAGFVNRFVTSDNLTSMLQDYRRGRPTEIDFINGAIVRLGETHGLSTPVNAFVVSLIKALEARQRDPGDVNGSPLTLGGEGIGAGLPVV